MYLFSQATRTFFDEHGPTGLRFVPVPSDDHHVLALPEVFVPAVRTLGLDRGGRPDAMQIVLPDDSRVVFAPTPHHELSLGRHTSLYCSEAAAELLLTARRDKRLKKFSAEQFSVPGIRRRCRGGSGSPSFACARCRERLGRRRRSTCRPA